MDGERDDAPPSPPINMKMKGGGVTCAEHATHGMRQHALVHLVGHLVAALECYDSHSVEPRRVTACRHDDQVGPQTKDGLRWL